MRILVVVARAGSIRGCNGHAAIGVFAYFHHATNSGMPLAPSTDRTLKPTGTLALRSVGLTLLRTAHIRLQAAQISSDGRITMGCSGAGLAADLVRFDLNSPRPENPVVPRLNNGHLPRNSKVAR